MWYWKRGRSRFIAVLLLALAGPLEGLVKQCQKHGHNIICVKDIAAATADSFGRVGIINKSSACSFIRFTKQEWSLPCRTLSRKKAAIVRYFPGEVLKYGVFQVGMVQDRITPGGCGEMRLMECYCGAELEPVNCSEVLWAATYKRGEHEHLIKAFNNYQKYKDSKTKELMSSDESDKNMSADCVKDKKNEIK